MAAKRLLLATSALVALGLASPMTVRPAQAQAEPVVKPGGALDLELSGFAWFRAHGGDLDNARLDDSVSTGLDFSNNTEVHVTARGQNDATGIEYGGTIEFEADTNRTDNTDETWVFVRGGFGEFRFGDENGIVESSLIGGQTIAEGTGGIDGDVIDTIGQDIRRPVITEDATKIIYFSPSFGGLSLGLSYTPNQAEIGSAAGNGDDLADTDVEAADIIEGGPIYEGSFGDIKVQASLIGEYGETKTNNLTGSDNNDYWGWIAGGMIDLYGWKLAAAYYEDKVSNIKRRMVNGGIASEFGPLALSLTAAYGLDMSNVVINTSDDGDPGEDNEIGDHPFNVVLSGTLGIVPGLALVSDIGGFSHDVEDGPKENSDSGYQALAGITLTF